MFERILVPLDGSTDAEAAVRLVEDLVTRLSACQRMHITLIRVVTSQVHWVIEGETGTPVPYTEHELAVIKEETRDYLDKIAQSLRAKGATVDTRVAIGNAAQQITKATEEIGADVVIMSTHGRTGIGRWAFGSVTERVLRAGAVPVLLVRIPRRLKA